MPSSAHVACSAPGCAAFADYRGKCKNHAVHKEHERGSRQQRGYDATWNKLRLLVLAEEPLCRHCRQHDMVTAAEEIDHIIPIRQRPDLRLDRLNLQSLCKPCHSKKTQRETGRPNVYSGMVE